MFVFFKYYDVKMLINIIINENRVFFFLVFLSGE